MDIPHALYVHTYYISFFYVYTQVQRSSNISEIDLDLVTTQKTVEQLKLGGDKPHLSEKALNRVSRRNRLGSPVSSSGIGLGAYTSPPLSSLATNVATEGISMSLDRIPGGG